MLCQKNMAGMKSRTHAAFMMVGMGNDLVSAVRASAARLGISPVDLLTAICYETNGRLDPDMWGGAGKRYLGLIQFGPNEQRHMACSPGMDVSDQNFRDQVGLSLLPRVSEAARAHTEISARLRRRTVVAVNAP
jgi:hypothetical protein